MENERKGIRLLKKGQSGLQLLFGRMGVALILLIVQFLMLAALFVWFEEYIIHYFGGTVVLTVFMVLHLLNKKMEPTIRNTWLVVVMAAPVFGSLLYWFTQSNLGHRIVKQRARQLVEQTRETIPQDGEAFAALQEADSGAAALCSFAEKVGGARVYRNTHAEYFPQGEKKLERLLEELEKAEKFIYLEYFIVSEGTMWGQILEILARKAAQGVDVRVMYDGTCEFILLPRDYPKKLAKLGIQCKVFSSFKPFVSTHYNYRDHRKILVIDGHTAFTGGVNLSDEYINIGSHYGHWKDTAVMLKGEAARGFTLLFLQMWNMDEKEPDFAPADTVPAPFSADGFVMPYGDNPLDDVQLGQMVYTDMLSRAKQSVRIMTPYLILDSYTENTLIYAAARGVRVQLMLPGIPDKYIPYALAKTHYKTLLDAGVEVYEYTPGFVHAKVVTADGGEAVVGTINFDYRSFCHHFECAAYLHGCGCIGDIEADFDDCLTRCRRVTYDTIRHEKWHMKLVGYLLKGFAPLL